MLERLKSPIVWVQALSIIAGAIIFFVPGYEETIKIVVGTLIALINVFAGLNNPTNRENF